MWGTHIQKDLSKLKVITSEEYKFLTLVFHNPYKWSEEEKGFTPVFNTIQIKRALFLPCLHCLFHMNVDGMTFAMMVGLLLLQLLQLNIWILPLNEIWEPVVFYRLLHLEGGKRLMANTPRWIHRTPSAPESSRTSTTVSTWNTWHRMKDWMFFSHSNTLWK